MTMENIRFSVLVAAFVAAVLLAPPAHADQITVFSLTTVYPLPQPQAPDGTASGTITIDTTTGIVEAINLSFAAEPALASSSTSWDVFGTPPNAFVEINESWITPQNGYFDVEIALPVDTLVGYTGGSICTEAHVCNGGAYSTFLDGIDLDPYSSGQLTPTPEPASLGLLGTGVLGLVGILRRKL